MSEKGVGARLLRKEDDRLMRGRGRFVGDIVMDGMEHVAFVRSPVAHARITAVEIPDAHRGQVYVWPDLEGVKPIRAVARLPGFKASDHYPLAHEKVRHVGEMIAMCVGATRAEAEDIAAEVPDIRVFHMETPSPYTEFGVKGLGEGGAIAPPAAIGNAVNDALRPLGVEVNELPMTPRRILAAIGAARPAAAAE